MASERERSGSQPSSSMMSPIRPRLTSEPPRTARHRPTRPLWSCLGRSRGQYVGYMAMPFANVFVDPENEADIFPKDFLLSLPRPDKYMGVRDFYDLDGRD